jgi:acyl carrier protein
VTTQPTTDDATRQAPPSSPDNCLAAVLAALAGQVGIDEALIDPDQPLSAVPDIESVHVLRAITEVEDRYGVVVPDDFLFETSTVRELSTFVYHLVMPG